MNTGYKSVEQCGRQSTLFCVFPSDKLFLDDTLKLIWFHFRYVVNFVRLSQPCSPFYGFRFNLLFGSLHRPICCKPSTCLLFTGLLFCYRLNIMLRAYLTAFVLQVGIADVLFCCCRVADLFNCTLSIYNILLLTGFHVMLQAYILERSFLKKYRPTFAFFNCFRSTDSVLNCDLYLSSFVGLYFFLSSLRKVRTS